MPFVTTRINIEVEAVDPTSDEAPNCTNRHTVIIEDGIRDCWRKIAEPPTVPSGAKSPHVATLDLTKALPKLPNELVDKILDYATGCFIHEAVLTTTPNIGHPYLEPWHDLGVGHMNHWLSFSSPETGSDKGQLLRIVMDERQILGVYKRRDWNDIVSYQLSHTFRQRAIKHYGQPSRHTFPYDPEVDSLIIKEDENATFLTGFPAASSVVPDRVDVFMLRPFDHLHPDILMDCTFHGKPNLPKSQYIINLAYSQLQHRVILAHLRDSHHDGDVVLTSPEQLLDFFRDHRQTNMSGHHDIHLDEIMAWFGLG